MSDHLRVFGPSRNQSLSELSDAELAEEAERRRRRRRGGAAPSSPTRGANPPAEALDSSTVRRYLKSLELEPGASLDEVRDRYLAMLDKYDPDKHAGDPEKHQAAQRVTDRLTEAYRGLREYLRRD